MAQGGQRKQQPPLNQNQGGIRHQISRPPPLSCLSAPSPLSSKYSRFVHNSSSGWCSLAQQVQMGSLIKMNHLARSSDPGATAERALCSGPSPEPGASGIKHERSLQNRPSPHIWPLQLISPLPTEVWLVCLTEAPSPLSDKVNRVEREHLFMRRLSSERQ